MYRQRHERLTYVYSGLDPDSDRMLLAVPTDALRDPLTSELLEQTQDVLLRANYHRLSPEDIAQALKAASQWGVRIRLNFSALQQLEVYARGCVIGQRETRNWRTWYRATSKEVPLYQRLVVVFRTDASFPSDQFDPRRVYLRMFKNVPQQDVDMMLPATGIQMTWLDHSKIVVPSLYAAAVTLWRFLRNVMLLAFFGVFKTVGMVLLVLFAVAFGLKSMFTYRSNTKRRYMLNMTQNLYYQNLDNNAGVLLRLLEEGEQQEACESVLAYFVTAVLLAEQPAIALDEIDRLCEELLQQATGIQVDFDVEATARNLMHLGLLKIERHGWRALPLSAACTRLDATWDSWFNSQPVP